MLNLASGIYGKGFGYWAARYAKEVVEIETPYDQTIDPADGGGDAAQAAGDRGRLSRPS